MIDLILNSDGQVDFGESSSAHFEDLLILKKGDQKFNPFIGVGIESTINDDTELYKTKNAIVKEYVNDGARVNKLVFEIKNDELNMKLDADYNS